MKRYAPLKTPPHIVAARRLVRDAAAIIGALPNHVMHWRPSQLIEAANNLRAGLHALDNTTPEFADAKYWRECAEAAEERSALLALHTARLLSETHDWAWSLCGEREGLDELRAATLEALREHVTKGGATTGEHVSLMESLEAESLPHLKKASA